MGYWPAAVLATIAITLQVASACASDRKITGFGPFKFGMSPNEVAALVGSALERQPKGSETEWRIYSQ